ncbi:MAG: GNAT family N-acetyltransferase [Treponema sp.]|jgi:ribosomal protein S18 acetylase RimI-like enzyme|nr:GNAT family N-acetyltransferase [Treponema sp.]
MILVKNNASFQETTMPVADFLVSKLPFSIAAYATYLQSIEAHKKQSVYAWALKAYDGIHGVIVRNGPTMYPVFDDIGEEHDLKNIRLDTPIHAFHGKARDVKLLERYAAGCGVRPIECIDYDVMVSAVAPPAESLYAGPAGLIIRQPGPSDSTSLFLLQAGYEQEEVLPKHGRFNPAVCRMLIERIVRHDRIMIAELGGRIVGKINTNAVMPSWFQIGGVYVHPSYRKRGIATRMTAVFVQGLLDEGKQVSLFVKKEKPAARALYSKAGFKTAGDYRISYY